MSIPIQRHMIWCCSLVVAFKFLASFCCWEYANLSLRYGVLFLLTSCGKCVLGSVILRITI